MERGDRTDEYEMRGIFNSLQVAITPFDSISVDQKLYSISTAAMGWTACARRIVVAETSLNPMCLK